MEKVSEKIIIKVQQTKQFKELNTREGLKQAVKERQDNMTRKRTCAASMTSSISSVLFSTEVHERQNQQ